MDIPHDIPQQIEIVKLAKAGDDAAIEAINALPDGSWMRNALADPGWPESPRRYPTYA